MKQKVLVAHNAYQHRGGEDSVVDEEIQLLRSHGHEVSTLFAHNDKLKTTATPKILIDTLWSKESYKTAIKTIKKHNPDIIHIHNTFPILSPSIYWAAQQEKIPVVQTLHNFRTVCPQAMFLRNGEVCEACVSDSLWKSIQHKCYRDSAPQTAVLASMIKLHRMIGTWENKISAYIALNEFCKLKFIESGLPKHKIFVKPNFVDQPAPSNKNRNGHLFVGRLSPEKGIKVLAECAKQLPKETFKVIGTGPESNVLAGIPNIQMLGQCNQEQVREHMETSRTLLLPSIWYENFPRTLVEGMAAALPCIASNIGALPTIVSHMDTGLLFNPGDPTDMAAKISLLQTNPELELRLQASSRLTFENLYTPETNYQTLVKIYDSCESASN